ncbi:hypothetical protein BO71DRAFT_486353 [Aspergillus ellipticus CBS 707.79]|uniref:L-ascorbate oxidase n=1 Tax=Aspergillus ellipticus CBS 707.79 TaxID=1448320 RepID=A0A319D1B2_9EURO|nr:hypothetical protein BO71DRAFT_486353 [Aspergillus ellipticus CBS 707.79]
MKVAGSALTLSVFQCLIQYVATDSVNFEFDLTWDDYEVAGTTRKMILNNGNFPGPTLMLKQYDDVEIVVNNNMPFPTSIHWHGIQQQGSPWADGVPGLTQQAIQPGTSFTYRWKADDYGAYMYHSHYNAQMDDGLYGGISIAPDNSTERPFSKITTDATETQALRRAERDTHPIIMSDWRAFTSEDIIKIEEDSGVASYCATSVLVNGKGSVYCPSQDHINSITNSELKATLGGQNMSDMGCFPPTPSRLGFFPYNTTTIPKGYYQGCTPSDGETEILHVNPAWKYVSYGLTNVAGSSSFVFSIDEHPMWVYAVDGRYIEPLLVEAMTVPIGTRYAVMVKLNQPAGNYTVRVANSYANQIINGTAVLAYDPPAQRTKASVPYIDEVGGSTGPATTFLNEDQIVPFPAIQPSMNVDATHVFSLHLYNSSYMWSLSNTTYPMTVQDLEVPVLFDRSSIPPENTIQTLNGTWVDLIINVTSGQPQHPLHKHSNKFFVIGQGSWPWNYSSVAEAARLVPTSFNFLTPQYRDTFPTPPARVGPSWLALRYFVQNPGPFFFHCHVMMHEYGGLAVALLDGVDAWPTVPEEYQI